MAHRGWHLDELAGMENSMASFRRALAEGYRYLEIDVHATSDGVVVVCHDASLNRTTDGAGAIAAQPWRVVRRARVRGRESVASLREVFEQLPEALLNIDVKADSAVEPTLSLVTELDAWDRICLASFSSERLARMRAVGGAKLISACSPAEALGLRTRGWLRQAGLRRPGFPRPGFSRPRYPGPGLQRPGFQSPGSQRPGSQSPGSQRVPALGPVDGQLAQVPVRHGPITVVDSAVLAEAHEAGIEVHVWTINDADRMRALLDLGVDGLISDRPDVLREVLAERGLWPGR
jgi:glycerophosphoryl diester phosphodiesterase